MTRPGRGPEGTPAQWYHFAEFVRRALHAAADQVEPQADGLEPIRARLPAGSAGHDRQSARWRRRRPGTKRGARRGGPGTGAQRP